MGIIFLAIVYCYVMLIAYVLCAVLGATAIIIFAVWGVRRYLRYRKARKVID